MILSDVIGAEVVDANEQSLGKVIDARFRLEGGGDPSRARLVGIIVSPRGATSYLGYERTVASRPVILDRFLRWLHRGSFLVLWDDVQRIGTAPGGAARRIPPGAVGARTAGRLILDYPPPPPTSRASPASAAARRPEPCEQSPGNEQAPSRCAMSTNRGSSNRRMRSSASRLPRSADPICTC